MLKLTSPPWGRLLGWGVSRPSTPSIGVGASPMPYLSDTREACQLPCVCFVCTGGSLVFSLTSDWLTFNLNTASLGFDGSVFKFRYAAKDLAESGISVLATEYIHGCTHGEGLAQRVHHPGVVVFQRASKNAKIGGVTVEWNYCRACWDIATIVFGWILAVMCEAKCVHCRGGYETVMPASGWIVVMPLYFGYCS